MKENLNSFADLGLSKEILESLAKKGFETPSPIQALVIPEFLKEQSNIIGQAQTGTGKTAAFSIPILETIVPTKGVIKALILTPTRELANQVSDEINSLIGDKKLRVLPVYGGQSIEHQVRSIKRGIDIIVGTPGRVIDLLERKTINLEALDFFVLDEADEMLNMGFIDAIEQILRVSNPSKQKMLFFSATMAPSILSIAKKYMKQYKILKVENVEETTALTEQIYFEVREGDKFEALCRVLDFEREFYGIVFARTKQEANEITEHLKMRGYDAEAIHGDITQVIRNRTLNSFKQKKINILVATDVAARGIDVNNLTHVINYSIPTEAESYVHRIGRTGRAGRKGIAITFVTPREAHQLTRIERVAKTSIKRQKAPTIENVIKSKKEALAAIINEIVVETDHIPYISIANDLTKKNDSSDVIAALLRHVYNDEFLPSGYREIGEVVHNNSRKYIDNTRYEDSTRLFLAQGRRDGLTPKSLLELIYESSKTPARKIRDIRIMDNFSFLTVPFDEAELILQSMNSDKTKKPLVSKAKNHK